MSVLTKPEVDVGRPRAKPRKDDSRQPLVLTVRGSPEWKEWLGRLSKHCRMSTAVCVDQALMEFAKMRGFIEPPPER